MELMIRRTTASFVAVLSFALCLASSRAQTPPRSAPVLRSPGDSSTDQPRQSAARPISSAVVGEPARSASLITIPVTVMDRNGRYVANLRQNDFRIFEDGVEQQVAYFAPVEKPFTVCLMLDVSGSTQYQLAQIRVAANTFLSRLRPNDRMMAITFDGRIHVLTEPANVSMIRRGKLMIPPVTDGTVLYDAVEFALKRMAQIPGRKAIVLMSDGVDQNSHVVMNQTLAEIAEQDVLVYTVQYNTLPQLPQRLSQIKNEKARRKVQERLMKGYALSEPYMRALADKTGGRFYRADDLGEVGPAFEAITAELGLQYSLGYYPKTNSDGSAEHLLKVRVRYPNLVVRARDRYTSAPAVAKQ